MRRRSQFPFSVGAFLRQLFFIAALAVFGTAESRAQAPLGPEQLDALTAPIALYPDTLLAQVLIASTYPAEVAQAAQWAQQNSTLQGDALDSALLQQPWDPSVKALVGVPTVLQQMNSRMDWTQQLGDAFLAQEGDVMDSVQRLRERAQAAGNLMTTEQQRVVTQGQTIVIEQANPQVIFVPSYNPTVVFGGWPYPAYPPVFWPTPPGYSFVRGLAWGTGFAIGTSLWRNTVWDNRFDWGGRNINVNVNRNNFTTINNFNNNRITNVTNNRSNWQHNATNRRGANYRDTATRERFGRTNSAAVDARRQSRGFDQQSVTRQLQQRGNQGQARQGQIGQQRGNQGQLGQQRGNQGQLAQQRGQQRANAGNQLGQNRSNLERRGQTSGFEGANSGARARQASDRGRSSRQMMAQRTSGGGGANLNRGSRPQTSRPQASRPQAAPPQVNRGGGARPQANRGGGGGRAGGGGGGRERRR
jgi:uncharacterized protein DUF3300